MPQRYGKYSRTVAHLHTENFRLSDVFQNQQIARKTCTTSWQRVGILWPTNVFRRKWFSQNWFVHVSDAHDWSSIIQWLICIFDHSLPQVKQVLIHIRRCTQEAWWTHRPFVRATAFVRPPPKTHTYRHNWTQTVSRPAVRAHIQTTHQRSVIAHRIYMATTNNRRWSIPHPVAPFCRTISNRCRTNGRILIIRRRLLTWTMAPLSSIRAKSAMAIMAACTVDSTNTIWKSQRLPSSGWKQRRTKIFSKISSVKLKSCRRCNIRILWKLSRGRTDRTFWLSWNLCGIDRFWCIWVRKAHRWPHSDCCILPKILPAEWSIWWGELNRLRCAIYTWIIIYWQFIYFSTAKTLFIETWRPVIFSLTPMSVWKSRISVWHRWPMPMAIIWFRIHATYRSNGTYPRSTQAVMYYQFERYL